MEPSGRLHHASSETTLIIARRSRSELIAPFIPFSKSPLCACTSFAILSTRASHRRGGGCVLATYPFTEVERAPECDGFIEKRVKCFENTFFVFRFRRLVRRSPRRSVLGAGANAPLENRIVPTPQTPFFRRMSALS